MRARDFVSRGHRCSRIVREARVGGKPMDPTTFVVDYQSRAAKYHRTTWRIAQQGIEDATLPPAMRESPPLHSICQQEKAHRTRDWTVVHESFRAISARRIRAHAGPLWQVSRSCRERPSTLFLLWSSASLAPDYSAYRDFAQITSLQ